ncbi:MAG: transcriptional regulator [Thermoplasmata archaeon]|nr:MAG: transcriptional regulator [Thermoplasmata archaeon]
MDRLALVQKVHDILERAGFQLTETCMFRTIGFDIIARKDKALLIVKVLTNVDSLSEEAANDLKALASVLEASLLLIGERDGTSWLDDDVVYYRYGVQTVTLNTLKNHLIEETPVHVYAAPGGFYVRLNGEKIKKIREQRRLSRGDLARMIHVSRRAIRMYEAGMDARVEVAAQMEEILHPSVLNPLDLLRPVDKTDVRGGVNETPWLYGFQREILSLIEKIGYHVIPLRRCPFEAVSKEKRYLFLTSVHPYNASLRERAKVVGSIARITRRHAVIFTDKKAEGVRSIEGTPTIMKQELKKMRDPYDIFDLIQEREE